MLPPVHRLALSALVACAVSSAAVVASAIEIENVGEETLTIDITNTAAVGYAFDNRDDNADVAPAPATIVNDTFGEVLDRLNVQIYYWRLRAGVRVDFATYFAQLGDEDIIEIAGKRLFDATGPERNDYVNSFLRELNTRYRTTIYPSKLFVGYVDAGVDITVGDFYANFGRGLTLSVRKVEELATDTTIRGMKAAFKKSWEDASLSVTGLAGQTNPIRIDEQSGRRLNGHGSPLFFGFPSADDFVYYTFDATGNSRYAVEKARPAYLEDSIFGLSVEAGPPQILLGAHATVLTRESFAEANARCHAAGAEECDSLFPTFSTVNQARLRDLIVTASGSINVPSFWGHGDAYVEVAAQHLADGRVTGLATDGTALRVPDLTGYAVYLGGNVRYGPLAFNLEGKHYRTFLPLAGNVNGGGATDPTYSAPEFDTVVYNQPPTAEPIYTQQFGAPNICVTGGRGKADYQVADSLLAYAWLGYYTSFTEFDSQNVACESDDPELQTNTWDAASGGELELEGGKSYVKAWVGARNTAHAEPVEAVNVDGVSDVFYREGYVRYDVAKHVGGDFTLQSQGVHRHRFETALSADSWNEGENYLALRWAPYFTFIFGYEYLGRRGCQPDDTVELCHYFSGGVQFKAADRENVVEQVFDTVNLFVGQRRGAIRCVSGVCRNFPPYEGARLELTSRF